MSAVVIDTNVLATANWEAEQAGPKCVLACIHALEKTRNHGKVLLDNQGGIMGEYLRHADRSGQPGAGDAFIKWLLMNQFNPKHCGQVSIRPMGIGAENYQEFPVDPDLRGFDPSDRKFVAVALASGGKAPVLNATDTDWWIHHKALQQHGVIVRFLCPNLMNFKKKHQRALKVRK